MITCPKHPDTYMNKLVYFAHNKDTKKLTSNKTDFYYCSKCDDVHRAKIKVTFV